MWPAEAGPQVATRRGLSPGERRRPHRGRPCAHPRRLPGPPRGRGRPRRRTASAARAGRSRTRPGRGTPAQELWRVPEPRALQVVVADLDDSLGPEARRTGPCRGSNGCPRRAPAPYPRPRSTGDRRHRPPAAGVRRTARAGMRAGTRRSHQPASARSFGRSTATAAPPRPRRARAVPTRSRPGRTRGRDSRRPTVRRPDVLHLRHHALARLVDEVGSLGDQPVQTGAPRSARTTRAVLSSRVIGVRWTGGTAFASTRSSAARR